MERPSNDAEQPGIGASLLVTVQEAAYLLALGRSTVYELIAAGRLPTIHIGRSVRIRATDVRALVAKESIDQVTAT
jgi:excisionase family DNA binding protein